MTQDSTAVVGRLTSMLSLQDAINSKINSSWRAAANPWYRAIWTECAELLDHVGWKWWKKQDPDLAQIHLELVDIFHFGLSDLLQKSERVEEAAERTLSTYGLYAAEGPLAPSGAAAWPSLIESFANQTLQTRTFDLSRFIELAKAVGLGEQLLYEKYAGKNVLNAFRQDNGYKTGEYMKIWHGREDNEWLSETASVLSKDPTTFAAELYRHLSKIYDGVNRG